MKQSISTFYSWERAGWRSWLAENFEKESEVWFIFPKKESGERSLSYNDAVEEALCFGWIDSRVQSLDSEHRIHRFSPRKKGSSYSRANIERLIHLEREGLLQTKVREEVLDIIRVPFVFPEDILEQIRVDEEVWANFQAFTEGYKRIRIAYIDSARKRPEEFKRRLDSFLRKTKQNKLVGYGGIEKYYR